MHANQPGELSLLACVGVVEMHRVLQSSLVISRAFGSKLCVFGTRVGWRWVDLMPACRGASLTMRSCSKMSVDNRKQEELNTPMLASSSFASLCVPSFALGPAVDCLQP